MDAINALFEQLNLMIHAGWELKVWIGATITVAAVIWHYAPVLDYTAKSIPVEDDLS